MLTADRRTQDFRRERKTSRNWVGQKKEKKKKERKGKSKQVRTCPPGRELEKEKNSIPQEALHTSEETSQGRIAVHWRRAQRLAQSSYNGNGPLESVSLPCTPQGTDRGQELKLQLWR